MNKVILMGRLTRDPELRYTTTNNTAVCNFTLAVERRFQRQGEEKQADFIPVVVWGKQAQFCHRYFRKGRQVAVVGRIQVGFWDDNDGKRHYKTEVIADELYFADSRPGGGYTDEGSEVQGKMPGMSESDDNTNNDNFGYYPLDDDDELPF
jgi:single-strand DNA-binding protein